jgi:hypothetical protein
MANGVRINDRMTGGGRVVRVNEDDGMVKSEAFEIEI